MNRLTKDELNDIMFALLEKIHDYRTQQKLCDEDEAIWEYFQANIERFLELYQKVLEIFKKTQ